MNITKISLNKGKSIRYTVNEAELIEGKGLLGSKININREISLISADGVKLCESGEVEGLCIEKFKADIIYTGKTLEKGKIYNVGTAVLEVLTESKECFWACQNYSKNKACILERYIRFARVTNSGTIKTGDPFKLNLSCNTDVN